MNLIPGITGTTPDVPGPACCLTTEKLNTAKLFKKKFIYKYQKNHLPQRLSRNNPFKFK